MFAVLARVNVLSTHVVGGKLQFVLQHSRLAVRSGHSLTQHGNVHASHARRTRQAHSVQTEHPGHARNLH